MNTTMFLGGAAAGLLVAAILVQVNGPVTPHVSSNPVPATSARQDAAALRRLEAENSSLRDTVVRLDQLLAKDAVHSAPSSASRKPTGTKTGGHKQGGGTRDGGTSPSVATRPSSEGARSKTVRIVIASGMSITEVADELAQAHVIDHPDVFVRLAEMGPYIRAGRYLLPVNADPVSVLQTLTTP